MPRVGAGPPGLKRKDPQPKKPVYCKIPSKVPRPILYDYVLENFQETYSNHHITGRVKLFVETWDEINFSIKISLELRLSFCRNKGHIKKNVYGSTL